VFIGPPESIGSWVYMNFLLSGMRVTKETVVLAH
jgi:hypothetical protein